MNVRTLQAGRLPSHGGAHRPNNLTPSWENRAICTEDGAKAGVTFENTSETESLVCLRYFGPEVSPDAPAPGAYRKNKF
ncbi:MAG: hypothetical protein EXS29_08730 [Pedosphaera sp.]|nr:hypothetical protein [Pedosphaera sp.]